MMRMMMMIKSNVEGREKKCFEHDDEDEDVD